MPAKNALSRQEKARLSRKKLLRSAERVFARNGFDHSTVADITSHASVSVGLFYHHFKSKEDIYNAIVDDRITSLFNHLRTKTSSDQAPKKNIDALIEGSVEFFDNYPEFFRMRGSVALAALMIEQGIMSPNVIEKIRDFDTYTEKLMTDAVKAGVLIDLEASTHRELCRSLITTMFTNWINSKSKLPTDQKAKTIKRIFYKGLKK